jgi:hypothetical protein
MWETSVGVSADDIAGVLSPRGSTQYPIRLLHLPKRLAAQRRSKW